MNQKDRQQWLAKFDVHPDDAILCSLPSDPERQLFSCSPASYLLYSDALYPRAVARLEEDGLVRLLEPKQ